MNDKSAAYSKIYTKGGDCGETGVLNGKRVSKDSPIIEALGEVDELNAVIGMVRTVLHSKEVDSVLERIQKELFNVGLELLTSEEVPEKRRVISREMIENLEHEIDLANSQLPQLSSFVVPGGSQSAAFLHLARTVCRRAERRAVAAVGPNSPQPQLVLVYLNRLSDLLFVLSRKVNL